MSSNKIKAVFKIGSDAVSLKASLNPYHDKVKYIHIYLSSSHQRIQEIELDNLKDKWVHMMTILPMTINLEMAPIIEVDD